MNFYWRGTAAAIACLGMLLTQSANAQRQREYQTVNDAAATAGASLVSYNSFETQGYNDSSYASCDSGYCNTGCDSCGGFGIGAGLLDRPGQFFAGAEYIYARASFSEALAYIFTDVNAGLAGPQFVEYDFDYESSYRVFGGYNFCDCGGQILFNYARYRSDASFNVVEGTGIEIFSPYEVDPSSGGTLFGNANVAIDSYDMSFARTIPLGSPLCCCGGGCSDTCCGDTCCDDTCCDCGSGCGSCWCPAWDITWSAGVRFADVNWSRSTLATDDTGDQLDSATTRLDFDGAGARIGLLGRRYFGKRGLFSMYARGDISLLVGNMTIETTTIQDPDGTAPFAAGSHRNFGRRVIPVTEIEAGLTAHVGNHVQLSSGYFISAWHDLGMRDEYDFENPATGGSQFQLSHYDDANILGFDGFFARAVVAY